MTPRPCSDEQPHTSLGASKHDPGSWLAPARALPFLHSAGLCHVRPKPRVEAALRTVGPVRADRCPLSGRHKQETPWRAFKAERLGRSCCLCGCAPAGACASRRPLPSAACSDGSAHAEGPPTHDAHVHHQLPRPHRDQPTGSRTPVSAALLLPTRRTGPRRSCAGAERTACPAAGAAGMEGPQTPHAHF